VTPDLRSGAQGDAPSPRVEARQTRPAPATLPAGWDEAVDLELDPATVPDPASVEVPDDLRSRIEGLMAKYPDRHSATLPALGAAQDLHGWCSPRAMLQVAAVMQVTPAYLSSVATFYDMLRTQPTGSRYVYVCTSVACHLRDAKAVYDAIAAEAGEQGLEDVELREFECLGACEMAPMASIDGRYVGPIETSEAAELVRALKEGRTPLPGSGLGDPDFDFEPGADPPGPPPEPDVHPAGGTWKDAALLDVPEPTSAKEGRPPPPEPLAPGTVAAHEHDVEEPPVAEKDQE
jgi:NADH:ubiquinone oxidoreductase subunit E